LSESHVDSSLRTYWYKVKDCEYLWMY